MCGCDWCTKHRRLQMEALPRGAAPRPRSGAEAGRTPCPKDDGQEELPHARGQGQRPKVPGCDGAGMAERSYPASEVRGCSREEPPHVRGKGRWPRGATPRPRPGAAAERSHPAREARGGSQEEQPHARGQRWRLGGATPRPRSGGCAGAERPRGAIPR